MARENLIFGFHCSVCGEHLTLKYEREDGPHSPKPDSHRRGDPTGAAVRYASSIAIDPCRKCMEPVEAVKGALNVLHKIADQKAEDAA